MGRRKASELGLSPGIWVRLEHMDNFHVRQLVTPNRPLGVVARDLIKAGLELEKRKKGGAKAPPLEVRSTSVSGSA